MKIDNDVLQLATKKKREIKAHIPTCPRSYPKPLVGQCCGQSLFWLWRTPLCLNRTLNTHAHACVRLNVSTVYTKTKGVVPKCKLPSLHPLLRVMPSFVISIPSERCATAPGKKTTIIPSERCATALGEKNPIIPSEKKKAPPSLFTHRKIFFSLNQMAYFVSICTHQVTLWTTVPTCMENVRRTNVLRVKLFTVTNNTGCYTTVGTICLSKAV